MKNLRSASRSIMRRASAATAVFGAMMLRAASVQADVRVDRNFGMTQLQGAGSTPAGLPPSLFNSSRKPVETASNPSIPDAADNDQNGMYSVDTFMPTMQSKNLVYVTPFPVPPHVNARVTINSVSWKYGTQTQPNNFQAALRYAGKTPRPASTSATTPAAKAWISTDATRRSRF